MGTGLLAIRRFSLRSSATIDLSLLTFLSSDTGRLATLAEGSSFDKILKDHPSLSEDQLRAVVAFAAATAKEDLPLLAAPTLE